MELSCLISISESLSIIPVRHASWRHRVFQSLHSSTNKPGYILLNFSDRKIVFQHNITESKWKKERTNKRKRVVSATFARRRRNQRLNKKKKMKVVTKIKWIELKHQPQQLKELRTLQVACLHWKVLVFDFLQWGTSWSSVYMQTYCQLCGTVFPVWHRCIVIRKWDSETTHCACAVTTK